MTRKTDPSRSFSRRIVRTVDFREDAGTYTAEARGRRWRITRSLTGWRLEFRDEGDTQPTYAGNHATLEGAKIEAGK